MNKRMAKEVRREAAGLRVGAGLPLPTTTVDVPVKRLCVDGVDVGPLTIRMTAGARRLARMMRRTGLRGEAALEEFAIRIGLVKRGRTPQAHPKRAQLGKAIPWVKGLLGPEGVGQ